MRKLSLFVAALFFAVAAFAQIDPNAPLQRDPSILYGKLDNGLTYYIRHNEKPAQRAEFYLMTNVGAIQETPAQNGLAHFLEHMCLNGTKNFPGKNLISYFESIGAKFGANINASTGVEQTMYMLNNIPTTRQGIIDTALLVMHDYSAYVTNDPAEIDAERGVIIEEWRTRNDYSWRFREKAFNYIFKDSKYATCNVIGTKENLETFPPEELVKFYKTWYRPDLQAVMVVGDIDPEYILAKLTELFKDVPAQENPQPKDVITIPDNVEPIVGIITDPEAQATTVEACLKSEPLPKEYNAYGIGFMNDLIENIISSLFAERLDDASKKPGSPFFAAGAGFSMLTQTLDAFDMNAACQDGDGIEAFRALMTEVEKAKRFGFTQSEYDRVKTNMIANAERATSNAESRTNDVFINDFASDFFYNFPSMDPSYQEQQLKGYLALINVDQINQVVSSLDFSNNMVILYAAPEREGLTHPTEQDFANVIKEVAAMDIESDIEDVDLGDLLDPETVKGSSVMKEEAGPFGSTVWTLGNGIKVTVLPTDYNKEQVLVDLRIWGGTSTVSDEDMASLDDNITSFYEQIGGLSRFTSSDLQKVLTGKIVSGSRYFGDLYHGISASCAPKDFETLLQLGYLMVTDPRFVEEEMAPALAQINAVVPNLEKQPNYALQKAYYETAYGKSPRHELISTDKMNRYSFATLEKNYKMLFSNLQGADLIITGNVNLDEIKPLVEKYIGALPAARKAPAYVDRHDWIIPGERNNVFETEMATPKTSCLMVVSGKTPSDLETRLLMSALSDILDLVYTETIRENEGGTYGVGTSGSVSSIPEGRAELLVQFDTDPDRAERLFDLAWKGLEDIAKEGPTAEQIDKVKGNMLKNISENRINNSYWLNTILGFYNTGVDQDTNREAAINAITAEKVQKFTASLLAQKNIVKVVMNPQK